MIEARQFVEAARVRGFRRYAGVPCSFLTPFINFVLQDPSLEYFSMANEGDAVALIAGVALGGDTQRLARAAPSGEAGPAHGRGVVMMQNSGLGNAVSPLTSLTWTFRLPQLLIVTWRGQPGIADEPQHALMGPITPTMLETMQIPWELFPTEAGELDAVLDRATAHMDSTGRPYALLMQKGSVAPVELAPSTAPARPRSAVTADCRAGRVSPTGAGERPSRHDALREVVRHTPESSTAVLASTGFCGRELYAIADRANHLYMVGSMGCVVPLGLGLALARPDLEVLMLDGDGAALMRMGAFATVGAYGPPNLCHVLLDNGVHDSTGGQGTVSDHVSFAQIAAACGYAEAIETDRVDDLGTWLKAPRREGPRFARLFTRPGTPEGLPRPSVSPPDVKMRFMRHFLPPTGVR
jgi:phosphonopyruvate decarboxylase